MKFIIIMLMIPLFVQAEVNLSKSDLFIPFDQDEELSYPHEIGIKLKTGGVVGGHYMLAVTVIGAKGFDVDKKVRYFDLNFSLETGGESDFSLKIQPVSISFHDPFGSSVNGVVELGVLPLQISRTSDLEENVRAKFYLISLKAEQIIPMNSMTLVMREAIKGIGFQHRTLVNDEVENGFSPFEASIELELHLNNLFSIIAGSSFTLENNRGDFSGKVYGGFDFGVDLGSFVLEFFAEAGYRYYSTSEGHGYLTLGVKIATTFLIDPKKKDD